MPTVKSFRIKDTSAALDFVFKHGFTIVTSQIDGDPKTTHCPLDLDNQGVCAAECLLP